MPALLQVCNVGRIVGGTAACAWTIARALPDWRHHVLFFSTPDAETQTAFDFATRHHAPALDAALVRQVRPDVILLHNVSPGRLRGRWSALTIQYVHSRIQPAPADRTWYCSRWLAATCGARAEDVVYQPVPRPPRPAAADTRRLRTTLRVGRICTPQPRKWPAELLSFTARLAVRFPDVVWEFVGAPPALHAELLALAPGRVDLTPAGWSARSRLWDWDVLLYHHPTLTESFGRTAAEALRAGCVPILDRRGGFCEQLAADTGFLCTSPADFESALAQLHAPGARARRARRGQSHADEHFSLARFRTEFLDRILQAR